MNPANLSLIDNNPQTDEPDAAPGKREQTKAQNREAILQAARAVFAELGYDAATVRDIIRRTGLASGTFYNYYRSKEEVARALASDVGQRLSPILHAYREQATDFESYLNGAVRAYFQFLIEEQRLWGEGRTPRSDRYPFIRVQTPSQSAVYEEVRSSIALVIERGLGPRVDTDYLTAATIGIAQNIGDLMLTREPMDSEGAAAFAVNLILRGLDALPRLD
ncbi:MAG TPA: TetR/AcrR family transcriptional regulator [Aliidongia sp.]|nr:TetR/AcrR family transcriptional regulator [Aliidongia sp.]